MHKEQRRAISLCQEVDRVASPSPCFAALIQLPRIETAPAALWGGQIAAFDQKSGGITDIGTN